MSAADFQRMTADVWSAFRWVRDLDGIGGSREAQLAWLVAEAEIRDLVTRRAYERDMSSQQPITRERYTNFLVRIGDAGDEAWLTAYQHVAATDPSAGVDSRYARCLGRCEKVGGRWQLAQWHALVDFVQPYGDLSAIAAPNMNLVDSAEPLEQARATAAPASARLDGGRETWHALRDDVWNAHHWLVGQPVADSANKLERLVDELAIRELLSNYAYAHDSRDLAWSASVFADDAMLANERWTLSGSAQVVGAFRQWNRNMHLSFHRFSNPIVRFVRAPRSVVHRLLSCAPFWIKRAVLRLWPLLQPLQQALRALADRRLAHRQRRSGHLSPWRTTLMAGGREQFNGFAQDVWAGFRWLSELCPPHASDEQLITRLDDELAIRQHLYSYTDAFDSKDLPRIVDHFQGDAVPITNRGTFPMICR
jgi:ketosteroid isomerase-like protein